jgi:hypothetical protein
MFARKFLGGGPDGLLARQVYDEEFDVGIACI